MQPDSTTPAGSGPDPDQDKYNPANKRWEAPTDTSDTSAENMSDDDTDAKVSEEKDENSKEKSQKSAAEAEAQAGGKGGGGDGDSSLPGENFSYNPNQKKPSRLKLSRKQQYAAAALGFGGGMVLFAAIPLLAPLKIMQFGNVIRQAHFFNNEEQGNDRTSKLTLYRRYLKRGSIQGTRLGSLGAKNAAKWDARLLDSSGVEMVYSKGTGRFVGFEIVDADKAASLIKEMEKYDVPDHVGDTSGLNKGLNGDALDFNSNNRILRVDQIRDPTGFRRRGLIKSAVKSVELDKISSAIGSRTLKKLSGVGFHPIDDALRKIVDKGVDRWAERKKEAEADKAEKIRNGDLDVKVADADGKDVVDENGDVDQESTDRNKDLGKEVNDLNTEIEGPDVDLDNVKNKLISRLKSGAAAAAVVSLMCGVQDLGETVDKENYERTVYVLERVSMENMALASQIPTLEGLSLGSIRFYWDLMTDEEGRDAFEAIADIEDGGSYKDGDQFANLRYSKDSGRFFLFDILDSIPLLGQACSLQDKANSILGKIPVVSNIIDIASSITEGALNIALEGVTGYTIDDVIGLIVDYLANDGVAAVPEGPLRGYASMFGGKYSSNDTKLASGGRIQNTVEARELQEYKRLALKEDRQEKNLFARLFDTEDSGSVLARAIQGAPNSHKEASQNFFALLNPVTPVKEYVGGFGTTPAYADGEFDYGIDTVGFSLSEMESEIADDPYLNADIVENQIGLDYLNSQYGDCFPTKLTDDGKISIDGFTQERVNQFTMDDKCSDPNNEELLRYRFYLFDVMTMTSLSCYEGDSESCTALGADTTPIGGGGGTTTVSVGAVNCESYNIASGGELTPRAYDADVSQVCQEVKQSCETGITTTGKILCEALKYDGVFYGNGYSSQWTNGGALGFYGFSENVGNYGISAQAWLNQRDPSGLNPYNLLECSGLTSVALYDAFGQDGSSIGCSGQYTEQNNPSLFRQVEPSEVLPGDFLTKTFGCNSSTSGHVAIAASTVADDGTIYVYETNSFGKPVRFTKKNLDRDFPAGRSRYIGQGATADAN